MMRDPDGMPDGANADAEARMADASTTFSMVSQILVVQVRCHKGRRLTDDSPLLGAHEYLSKEMRRARIGSVRVQTQLIFRGGASV